MCAFLLVPPACFISAAAFRTGPFMARRARMMGHILIPRLVDRREGGRSGCTGNLHSRAWSKPRLHSTSRMSRGGGHQPAKTCFATAMADIAFGHPA
jgi:hypothetical protein